MVTASVVLLVLASLAGLFLIALGLPGIWLLAAGVLGAMALHPGVAVTAGAAAAVLGLALAAEAIEFACGWFGAKRYGVSTPGVWGGLAGGLLGAFLLGGVIPVVGAVPGAFAGTFLGAFAVELSRGASREEAARRGMGAFVARMFAVAAKLGVGLATAGLGLARLL